MVSFEHATPPCSLSAAAVWSALACIRSTSRPDYAQRRLQRPLPRREHSIPTRHRRQLPGDDHLRRKGRLHRRRPGHYRRRGAEISAHRDVQRPLERHGATSTIRSIRRHRTARTLYGGIGANDIIVASSTESLYCDLFIAVPAATSASAATLSGNYRVASMEFLNGDLTRHPRHVLHHDRRTAKGGLGNVTIKGTAQNLRNAATTQTSTGATYTLTANGSGHAGVSRRPRGVTAAEHAALREQGAVSSPATATSSSPGRPTGYDMEIGVKAGGTALNGLYWTAYLNNYAAGDRRSTASTAARVGERDRCVGQSRDRAPAHQSRRSSAVRLHVLRQLQVRQHGRGELLAIFRLYAVGANGDIAIGAGLELQLSAADICQGARHDAPAGTTRVPESAGRRQRRQQRADHLAGRSGRDHHAVRLGPRPGTPVTASAPFPTTLGGVQVLISWATTRRRRSTSSARAQISAVVPYTAPSDGSFLTIQVVNQRRAVEQGERVQRRQLARPVHDPAGRTVQRRDRASGGRQRS